MPDGVVLQADTACTQDIPRLPGYIEGHPDVVPLGQGNLGMMHLSPVLQPAQLQGQ